MTTRRRTRLLVLPVLVLLALTTLPGSVAGRPAPAIGATGVPGSVLWLETLDRGDHFRLVLGSTGGGRVRVLAPQVYGRPALSPDGQTVAYTAPLSDEGSTGRYGLFLVRVDGSGRRLLSRGGYGDFDPAWSPDARHLVVSRNETGALSPSCCRLWIVGVDGSSRPVHGATSARQPTWSPEGSTIAFSAPDGIRVISPSGGSARVVVRGALQWPAFSPTGGTLAYTRRTGGDRGTISFVPTVGGTPKDTSAGSSGGVPESPVWVDHSRVMHINYWGIGENGRHRAEVRVTDVHGQSLPQFATGIPLFYLAWNDGPRGLTWIDVLHLRNTGSRRTDLHVLHPVGGWRRFALHVRTALHQVDPQQWQLRTVPVSADLLAVRLSGGGSGRVEVHRLSGASRYQQFTLHRATPMPPVGDGYQVAFADTGHGPDLYLVRAGTPGDGRRVELHVLSAASGYSRWSLRTATSLPSTGDRWVFTVARRTGDLVGVKLTGTANGRPEVHALSRSSGYQSYSAQTATSLPAVVDPAEWTFSLGDDDYDGTSDLFALQTSGTASGRVELSVLTGGSRYTEQRRTRHATGLHQVGADWSVRGRS